MLKITLLVFIALFSIVLAGVFPNFRADFEFQPLKQKNPENNNNDDWWKTANFYQIYPRSFQDSDGDGIGDLNGITSRLPYLKEIGITATWLSPIFTSPMADFGYDIANFTEIDKIFGTMEDFEKLLKRAKELDIKIILDFVPNHSSDECEWFKKSVKKDKDFKDFYVWHPGRPNPNKTERALPPSNWVSVFRGSAWTWNEERKEYYLHQFVSKQPDLNYRNPKVHETMSDVLKFWLKKGVAGFRIDAVPHIYEIAPDKNGDYLDEPVNPEVTDINDYGSLKHIYTVDQNETIDLVYDWRKIMDDFQIEYKTDTKVLLTETYSPLEIVMRYYGNETRKGAHIPFNFLMISSINNQSSALDFANAINLWQSQMFDDRTSNWVIGNHDKNRIGSRLGTDRIDMMNMIIMTLPGVAVTYQGEEIGMTDVWISWNDTVDPSACNSNPQIYENLSRDPERTPFQWDDSKNSGFSTANKTWLPMSTNYKNVNVKHQRGFTRSHLNVYKQLRALRNEQVFKDYNSKTVVVNNNNANVLIITRSLNNDRFITLANINDKVETVNLKELDITKNLVYVIVTDQSSHNPGDIVSPENVFLLPKESVVLRTKDTSVKHPMDSYYSYKSN